MDSVTLPAFDGDMGVLPGHIPYLVQLVSGLVRYRSEGEENMLAVSGGFAEVKRDLVSVFAETAEMTEEIDVERARQALEKAKAEKVGKDIDPLTLAQAEAAAKRASARLQVGGLKRKRK